MSMQQQLLDDLDLCARDFDLCGRLLRGSVVSVCGSIHVWVQGVAGSSKWLGGARHFLVKHGFFLVRNGGFRVFWDQKMGRGVEPQYCNYQPPPRKNPLFWRKNCLKSPLAKMYRKNPKMNQKTRQVFLAHFGAHPFWYIFGDCTGFSFGTFQGYFWYIPRGFLVYFVVFFGTFRRSFWYISGGVYFREFLGPFFGEFFGTFWEISWYIWGGGAIWEGLMVQFGRFYGAIQGVSSTHLGFFNTFCRVFVRLFLGLFLVPFGNEWGVVGCILRTVSR